MFPHLCILFYDVLHRPTSHVKGYPALRTCAYKLSRISSQTPEHRQMPDKYIIYTKVKQGIVSVVTPKNALANVRIYK